MSNAKDNADREFLTKRFAAAILAAARKLTTGTSYPKELAIQFQADLVHVLPEFYSLKLNLSKLTWEFWKPLPPEKVSKDCPHIEVDWSYEVEFNTITGSTYVRCGDECGLDYGGFVFQNRWWLRRESVKDSCVSYGDNQRLLLLDLFDETIKILDSQSFGEIPDWRKRAEELWTF